MVMDPALMSNQHLWDETSRRMEGIAQQLRQERQRQDIAHAISDLGGPQSAAALNHLYSINPQLGIQMEDQLAQRGDRARADALRKAEGGIILNGGMNGMGAPTPSTGRHPVLRSLDPHADAIVKGAEIIRQMNPTDDATWNDARSAAGRGGLDLKLVPKKFNQAYVTGILTLADHINGQGQAAQAATEPNAAPPGTAPATDYERAAMADPEGLLTFQGKQLNVTRSQLLATKALNDQAMQILGGVHDDASLQAAKAQARQLYQSFSVDPSVIDSIPDKYDPKLVRDLQLRGMNTSQQLNAIASENRVAAYTDNIAADNARADRSAASLDAYRQGQLENGRERLHRPQRHPETKPTPSTVIGWIMEKEARGQQLTPAEQKTLTDYRASQHPTRGGRGAGSASPASSPDLVGPVYQRGKVKVQYSKRAGTYVVIAR